MNEQLGKKLAQFSIGPIAGALLSFILVPLTTYFISTDENGKASMYSLASSILQMVLFLGLDQAYIRNYYEARDLTRLRSNVFLPPVAMLLAVELLLWAFRRPAAIWLFGSPDELFCVTALMVLAPAMLVSHFALIGIRMQQKGTRYSVMTLLLKILVFIVTVLFLLSVERSFRSVVWGNSIAYVLYAALLLLLEKGNMSASLSMIDRDELRRLLRFGLPFVPTAMVGWVLKGMDKVMLRTLSDYSTIGVYDTASKVATVLAIVQSCFTTFWVPVAHQWNRERVDTGRFVRVGNLGCAVMSLAFLGILLVREPVFMIFPESYQGALTVFPFLLLYPIMYTISEVTVMGIYFKEKTIYTLLITAVAAGANVALNWVLIPRFGAVGAAAATGLSYVVFFWCRTLVSRRLWFDFPLGNYLLVTAIALAASAVNTVSTGWIPLLCNLVLTALVVWHFRHELLDLLRYLREFLSGRGAEETGSGD